MDWVGRMICRALHIAVMLLRLNAEAQSLLSPRARDGHSADNLLRKRTAAVPTKARGFNLIEKSLEAVICMARGNRSAGGAISSAEANPASTQGE
jgi:hypothetical protein